MISRITGVFTASVAMCVVVAGCGNPYALKVNSIDYSRVPIAGSIKVTDAKLYRREALIDERRDEVAYLRKLLEDSKTQQFSPAVTRELQSVVTLAASLGASVDPAAGLNYRRTRDTSDIQQEIAVMKLQLQLDQLKRDAELMRAGLPNQTAPVNPDLGKVVDASPTAVSASTQSATLDKLVTSVNALTAKLQEGFGKNIDALTPLASTNTPFDTFNDRAAYRNLLNSALNAATLDELHDRDGAALVRINLSATVLPPANKQYLATLGLLRMTVVAPDFSSDPEAYGAIYREWVANLTPRVLNLVDRSSGTTFTPSPLAIAMITRPDLIEIVRFEFGEAGASCSGLTGLPKETSAPARPAAAPRATCQSLYFAVPRIAAIGSAGPANLGLSDRLAMLQLLDYRPTIVALRRAIGTGKANALFDGGGPCRISQERNDVIAQAALIPLAYQMAANIERQALDLLASVGKINQSYKRSGFSQVATDAAALRNDINAAARKAGCASPIYGDSAYMAAPATFVNRLRDAPKQVAVYQVGPRNQAQTVSTVARAAEAISLAASIAGKIPAGGIGVDGNIAYGRSAIGKADALERVPLVIAFAEAAAVNPKGAVTMPSFGWLMGPRTTLDARKKDLRLEQVLTTHDLSVDLSVPGWWPYLYLQPETAWAPTWGQGEITGQSGEAAEQIPVRLAPSGADFDNLTAYLVGASAVRSPFIRDITPPALSICATDVTLQIVGTDLWRADKIVIGGKLIDDKISVLPDMRGISVTLGDATFPATNPPGGNPQSVDVTVLTPYGPATHVLKLLAPSGGCPPKPPKAG